MKARGRVPVRGDATEADRIVNPGVESVTGDLHFARHSFPVVVDSVDTVRPVSLEWLSHADAPMTPGGSTFRRGGERLGFYGKAPWPEARAPEPGPETAFRASTRPPTSGCRSRPASPRATGRRDAAASRRRSCPIL